MSGAPVRPSPLRGVLLMALLTSGNGYAFMLAMLKGTGDVPGVWSGV